MTKHPPRVNEDEITVAGGVDEIDDIESHASDDTAVPGDELGRTLYTLLSLHPDIEPNFKKDDVGRLDDATKVRLIEDVRRALNVIGFKSDRL